MSELLTRAKLIAFHQAITGQQEPTEYCPTCNRPVFVIARKSASTPECFDCVEARKEYQKTVAGKYTPEASQGAKSAQD